MFFSGMRRRPERPRRPPRPFTWEALEGRVLLATTPDPTTLNGSALVIPDASGTPIQITVDSSQPAPPPLPTVLAPSVPIAVQPPPAPPTPTPTPTPTPSPAPAPTPTPTIPANQAGGIKPRARTPVQPAKPINPVLARKIKVANALIAKGQGHVRLGEIHSIEWSYAKAVVNPNFRAVSGAYASAILRGDFNDVKRLGNSPRVQAVGQRFVDIAKSPAMQRVGRQFEHLGKQIGDWFKRAFTPPSS
jgi:hypothetical protein